MTSSEDELWLKGGGEAEVVAAGRGDGGGGEEAGEIEDVEAVVEILGVGLQAEGTVFFFVEFGAGREIERERGLDASIGDVNAVEHLRTVFRQGLIQISGKFEGQAAAVFCAGGEPHPLGQLIANAGAGGVALILGVGKMSGELRRGADSIVVAGDLVAQEQAAGHREPYVAHNVGIAEEAGETLPVREFELGFRAIDDGFVERDGEGDRGVEDLIVIGEAVDVAAEVISVETELAEEAFAGADFEVVAVGRLDRKAKNTGVERDDTGRTGQKNIFEGRCLEDAIVGGVEDQVRRGQIPRDREARADGVLIHHELVVIPAEAGADGPFAEVN